MLVRWGFGRARRLRGPDGEVVVRPRRADTAQVIGAAVEAAAAGQGHRRIAERLRRPAETVRGWLRRFASRAEVIREVFTTLLVAFVADSRVLPAPARTPLGDALAAIVALAVAARRRLAPNAPTAASTVARAGVKPVPAAAPFVGTLSAWSWPRAVSGGGLFSPSWAAETINTSRPWETAW
ncbi:hypothetical protein SAMN04489713_10945 [Actinomadura madurae]|uniref:Homeodomain-like domain-containing protein n=1 Tax=Actinomadura madurae TaxID=1993 RepID=A0A1I5JL41_9ACTN|nr:hypothetical protein [Actinomadura madurae]SFO73527.1 hypothetical protein SAMN04489713_10945 [Actinomadura madurae]SPT57991.1 Uncharacterised protein [Actinomadura madurae]